MRKHSESIWDPPNCQNTEAAPSGSQNSHILTQKELSQIFKNTLVKLSKLHNLKELLRQMKLMPIEST